MYCLSKPQKSIYNMEKFAGSQSAVICGSILRKGAVNAEILENAVNDLFCINDALRIQIMETVKGPRQAVCEYEKQKIEIIYFTDKREFSKYAADYAKQPIDLCGKLCEVKMVYMEDECGLLVKLHHIIGDAWTMSLLANQFTAILDNKKPAAYSYMDYLKAEEKYIQSKRYQRDKDFFIECFGRCSEVTYLSDKQGSDFSTNRKTCILTTKQTQKLNDLAKRNNSSVFAVIMTLFSSYFSRIKANAEKFYIGTAILNRAGIEEQNTAGMFINTVPFLAEIESTKSFKENLLNISSGIIALMRHQHYNYEDLLSELRKEHGFAEKLYDVLVSYQNAKTESKDIQTEWYPCKSQTESLQIHIDNRSSNGMITVNYDYQTQKFSEKYIEYMHGHIINLINDAAENDNKKIYELNLLSEEEKNKLLYEFNNPKKDYAKYIFVHRIFEEKALQMPDKTAVIACDGTLTFDELNRLSNRIANALIEKGLGKGDIVAFSLTRKSFLIAVMFGILKAGAAYMPISPDYPQERIDYLLSESRAELYITNNVLDKLLENTNEKNPETVIEPDDLYCALHTSGSTGLPKLSLTTHKNMAIFLKQCDSFFENVKITISLTIITFDIFVIESVISLAKGIPVRLASEDEIFDQFQFENVFSEYSNVMTFATPTKLMAYIENSRTKEFLNHIENLIVGGEVFTAELYKTIKKYSHIHRIINVYGPTETTCWSTRAVLNSEDITIGTPDFGAKVYILDKYNNLMPIGCIGEICIAGDIVGAGYLNRPELTDEKFISNPFDSDRMYKTGDLAYWREDGRIMFMGRNDFQVKIRGLRIIENVICSVDGIVQSVVIVRKDKSGRQLMCAFYTAQKPVGVELIKDRILKRLPNYMLPHIFVCLDEMPLTSNGKINRKALPEVDLEDISSDTEYVKPKTDMQRKLADIMTKVLKSTDVGLNDNFFNVGGDSLKAIEFVSNAHAEGIYFNLQAIFDNPTIKELCEYIENKDKLPVQYNKESFGLFDSVLEKNIEEDNYITENFHMGNILLTGATGYLGIHILADFLDNERGCAYCMVRGENREQSIERLKELMDFYFGNKYSDLFDNRIIVLCSDLTLNNFGLDKEIYDSLLQNVQMVINAAASVKHYGSYEYFYEANVESVRKLIEFCRKSNAYLVHISTLSVSGNSFADEFNGYISEKEKHFYESSLYIGQPLENVYARSKFEAEKEILMAMAEGLKANIMRMGNLTNRFSDGKFQKNYKSNAFLKHVYAILNLGVFPEYLLHIYAEFTPVDEAARAVMTIAGHFSERYTVFHINSTKVVYAGRLIEYLNKLGISIQTVDEKSFTDILRSKAKADDTEFIYDTFINDMDNNDRLNYDSNIYIENDFTVKYLKALGFEWNDIGFEYIQKYIEYFRKIGYLEV